MLDAYNLHMEDTDIREAQQMTQPVVIQRLYILKLTIEEEYLESSRFQDSKTEGDTKSEESWGAAHFHRVAHSAADEFIWRIKLQFYDEGLKFLNRKSHW